MVAQHERCHSRKQQVLDLEHYLDVLERKPGAFAGSKPLEQWRQQGRWPASFDSLWQRLMLRHGRQNGTREMVEVIKLGKKHGYDHLRIAVEAARELGCADSGAILYLLDTAKLKRKNPELMDVGELARYERPMPKMNDYDLLLKAVTQ
jgi:hypothetical protein